MISGDKAPGDLVVFRDHGDVVGVGDAVDVAHVVETTGLDAGIRRNAERAAREHPGFGGAHAVVDVQLHHAPAIICLDLNVIGTPLVIGCVVVEHAAIYARDGGVGLLGARVVGEAFPLPELGRAPEVGCAHDSQCQQKHKQRTGALPDVKC